MNKHKLSQEDKRLCIGAVMAAVLCAKFDSFAAFGGSGTIGMLLVFAYIATMSWFVAYSADTSAEEEADEV